MPGTVNKTKPLIIYILYTYTHISAIKKIKQSKGKYVDRSMCTM